MGLVGVKTFETQKNTGLTVLLSKRGSDDDSTAASLENEVQAAENTTSGESIPLSTDEDQDRHATVGWIDFVITPVSLPETCIRRGWNA